MISAFSDGSPAVRLMRVCKRRPGGTGLIDLSLSVPRGEIFAVAGLNGAGKSTLLKCILDLGVIDGGSIELFGLPHRHARSRAQVAFLPEKFMPLYYLRGRDLLRYVLALHGKIYREAEAKQMCEELDLDPEALGREARELSKGMNQKLGLIACFLSDKPLLLLDEPASGLDARARAGLKKRLRALHEAGRTVVFSSHHLGDVAELADRVGIIHRGRLRFAGTPAALYARHDGGSVEQAFLACIADSASVD